MATAVTEATIKPHQLQVNRLRREEEEESWISGEELFTEGSSEDESSHHHQHGGGHSPRHSPRHRHHHHSPSRSLSKQIVSTLCSSQEKLPTSPSRKCSPSIEDLDTPNIASASEPAKQEAPHLTETTRRLSLMGIEETVVLQGAMGGDHHDALEEQEEIMLWRPKRGSIKLPHIQLDPPPPPKLDIEAKN